MVRSFFWLMVAIFCISLRPARAQMELPLPPKPPPAEPGLLKDTKAPTFEVYGFAMLDSGYEVGETDPAWFDVMRPTKLPSFAGEFLPDGNTYFSVRQSRFGARSAVPTGLGDLKTLFEFEFFGVGVDAGQTTIRLRHAYGELGQFGAGQFWSPFMDIDVFPNSLEYWGPNGMAFFRNPQIRWMPLKGESRITVALERPGASGDAGVYANRIEVSGVRPHFNLPDLSAEGRYGQPWGYVELAGILRRIAWVDTKPIAGVNLSDSVLGWGLNLSSNLNVTKNDKLLLQVLYGEGIENYMNDAPFDIGVKHTANPLAPQGVALPVLGVVAFVNHKWNELLESSAGYSLVNIQNSDAELPSDFHQGHYALGNVLFHAGKDVMAGVEFQFGRRVNNSDGYSVNDYRVQVSLKYSFSKTWTTESP